MAKKNISTLQLPYVRLKIIGNTPININSIGIEESICRITNFSQAQNITGLPVEQPGILYSFRATNVPLQMFIPQHQNYRFYIRTSLDWAGKELGDWRQVALMKDITTS